MKKLISAILSGAMLLTLLAGCGGSPAPANSGADASKSGGTPAASSSGDSSGAAFAP